MSTTKRIDSLKEKMLDHEREMSIEQARIITRIYKENEDLPQSRKRALALKAALEELNISIEPGELIVGNRTSGVRDGVVFPESGCSWVEKELDSLPSREQDPFAVREEDKKEFREEIFPYWKGRSMEDIIRERDGAHIDAISRVVKINQKDHAQGHIAPDVEKWLKKGPAGIKADVLKAMQPGVSDEQKEFYENTLLVLDGAVTFIKRYAALAEDMAAQYPENMSEEQKQEKADLLKVAEICNSLAQRPAAGFHEALQSLWFLFVILHMESNASSFSPGRMDQYLLPYYEKDIAQGTLNREEALEMIEALWLKFNEIVYLRNANSARYFAGFPIGFNIAIGGMDENGNATENDLSWLFLQAQEDLGLPQPNLSVRLGKDTSSKLMQKAIQVVSKGSGMPQFFNDEAIVKPMMDLGVSEKDARNYCIVGCVELTTQGNALGWSDAAMFNLNKALELTINHGRDLMDGSRIGPDFGGLEDFESFEDLEAAFAKTIDYYMDEMMKAEDYVEQAHQDCLPTAFLSTVIEDCIGKGKDVTAGGAKYNFSGIQMIQAANLADSLAALKMMVFDEKKVSPMEMMDALRHNFEGYEILQTRLLKKVPKYGNDIEWVDDLAARWAGYFADRLRTFTNYRGGPVHTGMYTVSAHVPMGDHVGATPDGRKAGTPLADGGMSPVYGRDLAGPTAVLQSVSRLPDYCTTNGGLLNMKFLPSFFNTRHGRDSFELFLRAFVDLHVPHIQFNVVTPDMLLDAKAHPEQHRSLTVRVAGYTAYFTELAGKLQDEIIERTSYAKI